MRQSTFRHPVAVLRKFLGFKTPEFARLVGCSESTIQSVELGSKRMQLSDDLASGISAATGVSLLWLLAGDPSAPMLNRDGGLYTLQNFNKVKVGNVTGEESGIHAAQLMIRTAHLCGLLRKAAEAGVHELVFEKTFRAFEDIAKQHGLENVSPYPIWKEVEKILNQGKESFKTAAPFSASIGEAWRRGAGNPHTGTKRARAAIAKGSALGHSNPVGSPGAPVSERLRRRDSGKSNFPDGQSTLKQPSSRRLSEREPKTSRPRKASPAPGSGRKP